MRDLIEVVGLGVAVRDVAVWLDHHPGPDEKLAALDFRETGGGPVATALVTLSRWRRRCAFAGIVGDDATGRFVRDSFVAEGVDVAGLVLSPDIESPASVILVKGEHRTICEWRQEIVPLPAAELERIAPALASCRFLLVDGRMPEAQVEAARRVRAAGGRVVLDAGHPRPGVADLLPRTDIAVLSHDYPRALPDRPDEARFLDDLVEMLAPDGPRIAGLTLGAGGSVVRAGEAAPIRVPGHAVEVEDTTGAGDVFHAGLVDALLEGLPLEAAVRFANAAAALECRGRTGRPPTPTREEVRRFAGLPT